MSTKDVSAASGVDDSGSRISGSDGKQHASVEEQKAGDQPGQPEDKKIRSADISPGRVSDANGRRSETDKHDEDQQRRQSPDEKLDAEVLIASTGPPGEEESHPLIGIKEDSGEKLHLEPPNRMEIRRNTIFRIRLLGIAWSGKTQSPLCAREEVVPNPRRGLYTEIDGWEVAQTRTNDQGNASCLQLFYSWEGSMECRMGTRRLYTHNHIVVGIMNRWTGVPREVLVEDIGPRQLFRSIRRASRKLRPWWIRTLSLKRVQGFAVYQCHPQHGYHSTVDLDDQTQLVLTELYHDYTRRHILSELRWLPWIQQYFNQGDSEQDKPRLALQLVLRWDSTKIGLYGLTPILLSLAIGFWFQYSQEGDRVAVVQTAWTIAGFIIGTASILIAIIAAITQIGDI